MDSFWKYLGFNDKVAVSIEGKVLSMSNVDVVSAIDARTDYKDVRDDELKQCIAKFSYKCTDLKCDFDKCLIDAKQSTDLKSTGIKDISVIVIEALKNNQELFTVKLAGGFIFTSSWRGQVVIVNETPTKLPAAEVDDRRSYGIIDVSNRKEHLVRQHERDQSFYVPNLVMIGGSVVLGASWTTVFLKGLRMV
jgi:hypothetical protein